MPTDTGEILIIVVSDGAGSAAYAELGSVLATQTFTKLLREYFSSGGTADAISREMAASWLQATADVLTQAASEAGQEARDFSSTLLVAIVAENSNVFIQIGDGAIVVSEGVEEGWAWVFWPQHGEFANTTNFVVSPNATELMEFSSTRQRIDEIAVFSDGIENLVLHTASRTVHAPFFDAMFPPVRQHTPGFAAELSVGLEKYLLSPRICDRTDDDKTLVLATRRPTASLQDSPDERPA